MIQEEINDYRVVWFGGLGARLFGAAPHVVPHNFTARYLSTSGPADTRTEEPCTTVSPWNTPPDACGLFTLK